MIEGAFAWFKNLVFQRRNLSGNALNDVTTGGVFSGRKAVEIGLADALGGDATARAYLESVTQRLTNLKLEDWALSQPVPWYNGILSTLLGINPLLERFYASETAQLYSITR
jgi:protease-4